MLLFSVGCASTPESQYAEYESGNHPGAFPISVTINQALTTEDNTVLDFKFKNENKKLVKIKKIKVSLVTGEVLNLKESKSFFRKSGRARLKEKSKKSNSKIGGGAFGIGIQIATALTKSKNSTKEKLTVRSSNYLLKEFTVDGSQAVNKWLVLNLDRERLPELLKFQISYQSEEKPIVYSVSLK